MLPNNTFEENMEGFDLDEFVDEYERNEMEDTHYTEENYNDE